MQHTAAAGAAFMRTLHEERSIPGIFMSFWLRIPPTQKRAEQMAHLAVSREGQHLVATLIPIEYFPPPGSNPPRVHAPMILPHAIMLYIRRRLRRYGISRVDGAISEREVDYGIPLTDIQKH